MIKVSTFATLPLLALMMFGCGGGGSSPVVSAAANPTVKIAWGARTRDVQGPGSALSAVINFKGAGPQGTDVGWVVNRGSNAAAFTQTCTSPVPVSTGVRVMQVTFQSSPGGQGGVVATATASVNLAANGSVQNPDGSTLGTIQAVGNLATIVVVGGQTGTVGTPMDVAVSGLDAAGNQVAITSGSAALQVQAGNATVDSTGYLVASTAGQVNLTATVDGIVSATAWVTFTAPTATLRSLPIAANGLVLNPSSGTLWASIPSTASQYGNSVIEIAPSSGTVLGSVFVGSEPKPMAISDDGSTLFVGLEGASSIVPVTTGSRSVGTAFSVGAGSGGAAQYISDIAVQPGSTSVIAVTRADISDSGNTGPEIISGGTILPNSLSTYAGQSIAFASPTHLYAYDNTDSSFALYNCLVDGNGVSSLSNRWNVLGGVYSTILVAGGRVYGSDGTVLDATSGTQLGKFATSNSQTCAVDVANHRAFFLSSDFSSSVATIEAFDTTTFLPVGSVGIPASALSTSSPYSNPNPHLVRFGAKGLAFMTANGIYFLDQAPGL